MFDERSTNFDLPLPHMTNPLRVDVDRLRSAITSLDTLLKNLETAASAAMHYAGDWDAAADTPAIPTAGSANKGSYYVVAVAGETTVDGTSKWVTGDWIVSTGTKWVRIANSEAFDADAIKSGTLSAERIPNLPMAKVTGLSDALSGVAAGASAALNGGQFRNKLPDGRFDFWCEAVSQTSSGYGSDTMWFNESAGSSKTHTRQSLSYDTDLPAIQVNSAKYFSRTAVTSAVGVANRVLKVGKIEDVRTLAGKKATLSFYAKADAEKNIAVELAQVFGTGGTPSADVTGISSQLVALTTEWARYSVVVDVPSIAEKTLGTSLNDCLSVNFWFDAGSNYAARAANLGQQSGTFDLACVQLEAGETPTAFEELPASIVAAIVGRYYETSFPSGAPVGSKISSGACGASHPKTTSAVYGAATQFRYEKRTGAMVMKAYNVSTGAAGSVYNLTTGANVNASLAGPTNTGFSFLALASAPSTENNEYQWHYTADARL